MKIEPPKYNITQCALYKCNSRKRLERLLCIEPGGLKDISDIISYHSFEIDKKCTSKTKIAEKRKITAPDRTLKLVQARILRLVQRIERPEWLISGEKGKCYIDNGKAHLLGSCVLTIDVKKFYDNCKREPVYQFFIQRLKVSKDVAALLTDIVTYNGGIPTGCPTSQMMAFYAYQEMFTEINEIAQRYYCKFTLYVDDMTFSSEESFSPNLLSQEVDKVLRKYGHKPKYQKVKYYSKHDPKPITGTIVTPEHTLDVPISLQRKVYDNFQEIKHFQGKTVTSQDDEKTLLRLRGQIQSVRNIDSTRFPEIGRITSLIRLPIQEKGSSSKRQNRKPKIIKIQTTIK